MHDASFEHVFYVGVIIPNGLAVFTRASRSAILFDRNPTISKVDASPSGISST
jgi:hypothetical protein